MYVATPRAYDQPLPSRRDDSPSERTTGGITPLPPAYSRDDSPVTANKRQQPSYSGINSGQLQLFRTDETRRAGINTIHIKHDTHNEMKDGRLMRVHTFVSWCRRIFKFHKKKC